MHLLAGKRAGLLTNQTGIDRAGVSDLDRLLQADAQVSAILTPEHGYRGVLDQADIGHGVDSATGLPVYSLYGDVRAPTPDMLRRIDLLLVDLQDIGARPYTYISTTLLAMRACRAAGVPVLVLDRPNPIGGLLVQGPVLDTAHSSFVGMLPVPLRHGMTLGELARLGNDLLDIGAELVVIPAAGWVRDLWFDTTGLPWVRPSPSMPSLESASHYPGTVLFEATNLSVGRGTPVAFQVLGAPWLDVQAVRALVGARRGVGLRDTVVTPRSPPDGKYPDQAIAALRLTVLDRAVYDPVETAVALVWAIARVHPDSFRVDPRRFARLAGTDVILEDLADRDGVAELAVSWRADLADFRILSQPYLLYR